jgi:succinyl-CoA synthetase beta subunit
MDTGATSMSARRRQHLRRWFDSPDFPAYQRIHGGRNAAAGARRQGTARPLRPEGAEGILVDASWQGRPPSPAPWIVKAQIPVGGRGRAGGIRRAADDTALARCLGALTGMTLRGHPVRECRIEAAIAGAREAYVGVTIDPAAAAVRVLVSPEGGVDVEESGGVRARLAVPEAAAVAEAIAGLSQEVPAPLAAATAAAGRVVAEAFFALEAALIEIKPALRPRERRLDGRRRADGG